MKIRYTLILAFALLFSCQKTELPFETDSVDKESSKLVLKSMLENRNTLWTADDLNIPSENAGWKEIRDVSELAFLLEFGSTSGEKYRLCADIDVASSELSDKFTSEIGAESFEDFEFDGNGKTVSGLDLPWACGVFSKVKNSKIYDLTIADSKVGSESNIAYLNGTGVVVGSATGTLQVSGVNVVSCEVLAPCKVGGFAGSLVDVDATFNSCNVTDTEVATIYVKGVSGWCGGFAGFVGREVEKSSATTVSVIAENCSVTGGNVRAHMESSTRYSGTFLGTLNGYDSKEVVDMINCQVSANFVGLDSKATSYVSIYPDRKVGGHKYMNGYVCFDGLNYVKPWDGTTKTQPALINGEYHVYTAAELAWFQGKTETTNKILICNDIDLGGHLFIPIKEAKYIDGQKVDGNNSEIRNLKVSFQHSADADGYGGAFINRVKTDNTVHKNLNFRFADVYTSHYAVEPEKLTNAGQYGNAYAATLCSRCNSGFTYNVSNVHCYDGKITGVCKMGGLLGGSWGTLTVDNCSVENYFIQNYQVNCLNAYQIEKTKDVPILGTQKVTCYAEFYTEGECGGLIGFLASNSEIKNSAVRNTKMKCFGQNDQLVSIQRNGSHFSNYLIPGRHVNQFIGDIRTQSKSESEKVAIKIVEPTVHGNVYVGTGYMYTPKTDDTEISADSDQAVTYDYNYTWSKNKTNYNTQYVGSAYYVGVDILSIIHEGDYQGTVTITKDSSTINVVVDGGLK